MDKNEIMIARSAIAYHRHKAELYRNVHETTGMKTAKAMAIISENAADELERLIKDEQ
jgi:hypothetical protein